MFKFITSRPLWVNIVAAIALAILLVFAFLHMLNWITRHGEHLTVPDVRNQKTEDAIKLLKDKGFDVMIQDSVYTDTLPKGIVIKQLPDPNATVKVNRTVFITVNRLIPPMIDMPDLKGQGLNFALDILHRNHLTLEDTIFKTDFAKGSVLEQRYNGNTIAKGAKVPWGSGITLVVASGLGDTNIIVPDLIGMTFGEARAMLDSLGITVVPVLDNSVSDTVSAFVYKQHPEHLDELHNPVYIKPGMFMDLSLSKEMITKDSVAAKSNN